MSAITKRDVRKARQVFILFGPLLESLTDAAEAGTLPNAEAWARRGRQLAELPASAPMRLIARATRRSPAGVARYFSALELGLLLGALLASMPEAIGAAPRPAATTGEPTAPDVLTRWLTTPPAPSRN